MFAIGMVPVTGMRLTRVLAGDVRSFTRHDHGQKFHALLCDPPYHRIACALEDAGLRIHEAMTWLNGNSFPQGSCVKGPPDYVRIARARLAPWSQTVVRGNQEQKEGE